MLCNPAPSSPNSPVTRKARRRRKTSKEERICPICAHFFKKAEHLARHMRAHSKEKPFGCPVCHKNFARQDTLLRHSRCHPDSDHYQAAQTTSATAGRESADRAELTSGDPIPHQGPNDSYGLEVDPVAVAPTVSPSLPNSTAIEMPAPTLSIENKNTQLQPLVSTDPELMLSVGPSGYWRGQSSPAHIFPSFRTEREWETLLTGDAFDLDAANLSLLHATADLAPGSNTMSGLDTQSNFQPSVPGDLERENGKLSAMQKKWHTYCERPSSGYITPDIPCGGSIDETLRDRLAQRLEQRMQYGILPSTPFLVHCIQAYFNNFHSLFPVVHMPTFRPTTQSSILLLSICSVGSLFIGSSRALSHGISMYERLNKAILASWDSFAAKPSVTVLTALQASLIGQTFGLVMGRPRDLYGIELFHGSVVAWARNAKLFQVQHSEINIMEICDDDLEQAWLSWVQIEVKKRIVLGLYIHDAELAKIYHHEPLLRHSIEYLPRLFPEEFFSAPSAHAWKLLMLDFQNNSPSNVSPSNGPHPPLPLLPLNDFFLCASLESICAQACENCNLGIPRSATITPCHDLLNQWYVSYEPQVYDRSNWSCLKILWHSIYIMLYTNLNALECACGRDGFELAQDQIPFVNEWIHSTNAKRCVLHAVLIQQEFESLPVGMNLPIYVPMCLYYCGLIWSCFMCFGDDQNIDAITAVDHRQFAELCLHGLDDSIYLSQMGELRPHGLATSSILRIINLLQRIHHWKISQSLASTLLALVENKHGL